MLIKNFNLNLIFNSYYFSFQTWMLNKIRYGDGQSHDNQLENGANGNDSSELHAILTPTDLGVCLLRDSPYRILRVSCLAFPFFFFFNFSSIILIC